MAVFDDKFYMHLFNYESEASELLENLEDMFPLYYIDSDAISRFQPQVHTDMWPVELYSWTLELYSISW